MVLAVAFTKCIQKGSTIIIIDHLENLPLEHIFFGIWMTPYRIWITNIQK